MSNLLSGFIYFIGGAMLWLITSLIGGTIEGLGGGGRNQLLLVLMYIGGIIMIIGPIVYWIIIPIRNKFRKK